MAATQTNDATNFPRSNIFASLFQKDRNNLAKRILREAVPYNPETIRAQHACPVLFFVGTPLPARCRDGECRLKEVGSGAAFPP
jgi:hypothetical protein